MEMVKSLGMTLVYCPRLTCVSEGWQYHSLVDLSDSIPLPDICTKSAKSQTSFGSSGSNLITNVPCSEKSAFQIGEFIHNLQFLSIHSDGWFVVRLSRCWLMYYLSLFVLIVRS